MPVIVPTSQQGQGSVDRGINQARHVLSDAPEQGRLQQWLDIEVNQLSAGDYQGACTVLRAERMHLVHELQNQLVHKAGVLPRNSCTISFALAQDPKNRFSHYQAPEPLTFLLPAETEFDIMVPGGVGTLYVCVEQDRLLSRGRLLNESFWESAPNSLTAFNTPVTGMLSSQLLRLLSPAQAEGSASRRTLLSTQTETLVLDSILLALNEANEVLASDTPAFPSRQRAYQRVRQAREFIDDSLRAGRVPSIVDICVQSGTSARSLQYAFREVMQMTPVAYLRTLRLNKVRSELRAARNADATVTQLATDWGFLHLGEFARDYHRLFAELPSETLARARGR